MWPLTLFIVFAAASIALGAKRPSKILQIGLDKHDGELTTRKGVFMVGNVDVQLDIKESSHSLLVQFFGGQGLLLQSLRGRGQVLLRSGGVQIRKQLDAGESIRIKDSSFVACTRHVSYDVTKCSSFKNILFGDETIFVSTLTGPGTIWLQGMNPRFFVKKIEVRTESSSSSSSSSNSASSKSSSTN